MSRRHALRLAAAAAGTSLIALPSRAHAQAADDPCPTCASRPGTVPCCRRLGGGLSYVLTGSTEVYASYIRSVYGRDAHKIDNGISFGVSFNFSPKQVARRYFPKSSAAPAEAP